MIEIRFK